MTDLLAGTVVPEDMVQFYGEAESDKAGAKLADLGDVNGDGYDDFLIGANDHDEFYDQDGAAYLLYQYERHPRAVRVRSLGSA